MSHHTSVVDFMRGARVYFDVNPLIYFVEQNKLFSNCVNPLFEMIGEKEIFAFTSSFSLTETLIQPNRKGLQALISAYKELLLDANLFTLHRPSNETFIKAAELGETLGMRTPDALHLACAIAARCTYLVTNDKGFKSTENVKIVLLSDLDSMGEFD